MIPRLEDYALTVPASLGEALDDLARHPDARPFAGGTDLMVVLEAGHLPPGRYVSLQHCRELQGIADGSNGGVAIGALTTYTQIRDSVRLARDYPLLGAAARETGGIATQNRGTIGGNIANASPAADTPPVLLVYDAELEIASASGSRRVPYAGFHRGYKQMDLAPGELIARIHLPPRIGTHAASGLFSGAGEGSVSYYRKVGTRRAQAISKVCFAGTIRVEAGAVQEVRIALGSVAPTAIRAVRTEDELRGQPLDMDAVAAAERTLLSEIAPIDDLRSTARYRARVAANLLREFLGRAAGQEPG
ncbi:MAG TPA: xanthine dehydrogenase family protein subunit M [Vicinamibacterales bacterium]|nr:xanthine dehydrogenase family protein subunit M [Vicinamibacterales bacterium]